MLDMAEEKARGSWRPCFGFEVGGSGGSHTVWMPAQGDVIIKLAGQGSTSRGLFQGSRFFCRHLLLGFHSPETTYSILFQPYHITSPLVLDIFGANFFAISPDGLLSSYKLWPYLNKHLPAQ